jgi:anti-sigma factor RsiW
VHPFVRGAAECLFDRLSDGGIVLLDDAARPGERIVARRWKKRWPQISFTHLAGGTKGTLHGRKRTGKVLAFPERSTAGVSSQWRRAAAAGALLATGWVGHDLLGDPAKPAHAASFIDEADASYAASVARQAMRSQIESTLLDRAEIERSLDLALPAIPAQWRVTDVQVYPSDYGNSVSLTLLTDRQERITLYAQRAETPAEADPLAERREDRALTYWENGPFAYALTGKLQPERMLLLASKMAAMSR